MWNLTDGWSGIVKYKEGQFSMDQLLQNIMFEYSAKLYNWSNINK